MKNGIILLLITFVLLLLVSATNAQVEDFGFRGDEIIDAFRCTSARGSLFLVNTGDYISTYSISIDGGASEWATVTPGSFSLNPGKEQMIDIYLDVPCDAKLGRNLLKLYINTASGLEDLFEIEVIVQKPLNVEIEADELLKVIDPCTQAVFDFKVKNTFDFQERYTLSLKGFEDESRLSEKRFILEGHESKEVTLTITPEDCKKSGTFKVFVLVDTDNSGIRTDIEFELEITSNGIVKIAPGVERIKANYSDSAAEIDLVNKGDESTDYTLTLDGPDWVALDRISLNIGAGDTGRVKILTKPSEEVAPGDHGVTIKAIVDKTGAEYTKELNIRLIKPTFFDVFMKQYSSYFIGGVVLIVIVILVIVMIVKKVSSEEYKKKRKEAKNEKEKLKALKKKEKERLKKEKEKETLQKKKELEKAKKLKEKELKKEFAFIPKKITSKKVPTKGFLRLILFLILLIILVVGYHYRDIISQNLDSFITGIIILIVLFLIDRIITGWSRVKRFKRVLANKKNVFNLRWRKGVGQVSVVLSSPMPKLKLRFRKGRQRNAYSAPGEKVYQYFLGYANVDDEDVKEAELRFRVSNNWMKRHAIYSRDLKLMRFADGKWTGVETIALSADKKYSYFKSKTDGLGQFAILGKSHKKEKESRRVGIFIGIILLIIAIAIAGYLPTTFKKPTVVKGIPPQIWGQGTTYTLDLTLYFKDPESRPLEFKATDVEDIDIWISSDGIATFTPDFDFYGERTIVFTAFDDRGLEVNSNNVKLVVTKGILPLSVKRHLGFILAGVIAVIFILLLIIFRKPIKELMEEK